MPNCQTIGIRKETEPECRILAHRCNTPLANLLFILYLIFPCSISKPGEICVFKCVAIFI